jgi:hypothetical protein
VELRRGKRLRIATAHAVCAASLSLAWGGARADDAAQNEARARSTLRYDLERIVEGAESTGWKIDKYEYEELMPDALQSICAAQPAVRQAVLADLDERIRALGGPVEEAFRKTGDIDDLGDLLFVTRVRTLLADAIVRARTECPFWLLPRADFRGLQTDAYRFTLNLEGGGLFAVRRMDGRLLPGGGGSGRLLLGRGLDERWTVLAGAEFGTIALFEQSATGTKVPITFVAAVPFVIRRGAHSWRYDLELAPIAYFDQEDTRVSWGGRVGFLVGASAVRIRRIIPWAGLGIAVEGLFPTAWRAPFQTLKGGLRIGFDWDY